MRFNYFSGWTTILVLISGLLAGNPQNGEVLVSADPVRLEIVAGQVKTLHILLTNAHNIYGIDLQSSFDPAAVEILDADSGQTGIQMIPGTFPKPDFIARNLADNTTGKLRYVATQLNPTPPGNGKGLVLSIQFRGKVAGKSSRLTITSVVVADRAGTRQTVTTRAADLVIVRLPASESTLTPTFYTASTFIPAVPTWDPASFYQTRLAIPAQATPTASLITPTTQPAAGAYNGGLPARPDTNAAQNEPAIGNARETVISDQVLTAVTVGGFSATLLVSALAVCVRAAKRRKARTGKSKQ
jgi:hypothetical protein